MLINVLLLSSLSHKTIRAAFFAYPLGSEWDLSVNKWNLNRSPSVSYKYVINFS